MKSKLTRLVIHFKEVPHWLMREALGEHITANRLMLGIHPDETISLTIQTKNPGARLCLRTVRMLFDYHQGYQGPRLEAYEKALLDCMLGDRILFWRQDGLELCWEYLDPVLKLCETCGDRAQRLKPYAAGSWGPPEAAALMAGRPLPWD
jgi:glucose-6-phosphate 1-dehydrogenase